MFVRSGIAAALLLCPAPWAGAQTTSPAPLRREFVVAPLPLINPTLDNGLALVVGALYPLSSRDRVSPPSATFIMGMATSNESWAAGAAQTLHLHEDRYRVLALGAYFDVNIEYFGIGTSAGDTGRSVMLNQAGGIGIGELLLHLGQRWYVGPRYRLIKTTVTPDLDPSLPVPADDLELRTAMLGPHVERDSRDNQFYPRRGTLFDAMALFAGEAVGGRRTYQVYQASFSSYVSLGARQVLASRVNSCATSNEAPFYDLCFIGQYRDLRGYPSGQYRDELLLSGQAEYRLEVWRRIGAVVFSGIGEVAPSIDRLSTSDILPSAGAGFRFRLTRQNHLNLRVDYAWGRKSNALYVSVAEAF